MKAIRRRVAPLSARTLDGLLAEVFTASTLKEFKGKFRPENFSIEDYDIHYESSYEDEDDTEYFDGDMEFQRPFSTNQSQYCCGLLEIGNFSDELFTKDPAINAVLMQVFLANIQRDYKMVFGTVTTGQRVADTYLRAAGFVQVADYRSQTTKAHITVLMKDFSDVPVLSPGDLNFSRIEDSDAY